MNPTEEAVEFQKEVTRLIDGLSDVDQSIARSALQAILIGQLSVSPKRLEMALKSFKLYLKTGELQ